MPTPRTTRPLHTPRRRWWPKLRAWLTPHRNTTATAAPPIAGQHRTIPAVVGEGGPAVLQSAHQATATLIRQGWNLHQPPYGYLTMTVSSAGSASGRARTRLTPDPHRARVVQDIFYWRAITGLDVDQITQRLNNNPDRYPPPGSSWQPAAVAGILTNLKYTGYQTFNTRDEIGRFRPAEQWVLSEQPAHRALITTALFWAAQNPTTDTQRALRHRLLALPRHLAA
ncbi:recombinase family protein [Amycolatopsis sp. cmx-11-32]|uniref:recombinase family protein n=1 Tax=Amycolatopsis sp. cmx-11-32 TaxID=2785796 RepID=UPI0039E515CD